jgi:hypothetical protein
MKPAAHINEPVYVTGTTIKYRDTVYKISDVSKVRIAFTWGDARLGWLTIGLTICLLGWELSTVLMPASYVPESIIGTIRGLAILLSSILWLLSYRWLWYKLVLYGAFGRVELLRSGSNKYLHQVASQIRAHMQ